MRDTLHSLELSGEVRWNGINQLLRENGSGISARVKHETSLGSEATANATGEIPEALINRELPLGSYPPSIQFSRAIFDFKADVYVLSIQPDLQIQPARHRHGGFLFHPDGLQQWEETDRQWLMREFASQPRTEPDAAMLALENLIGKLRTVSDAPILIYNVSSLVPGETIHCYAGLEDILSTRIKHFNLALIELSQRTGISIVDVDRIVAETGAAAMKIDTTHLTEQGCRAVAEEVVRILQDYGCIPEAATKA
ncbi:MAG: hypothetical protein KUG65_09575 [Sphingomonadaceae bacterium]|nr:hypothetical protein [Sphingomonadaceae bacterium]